MAKLNWLVQRQLAASEYAAGLLGVKWLDCGDHYMKHSVDKHGNKGYQDKGAAKSALAAMRHRFPGETYRLIRIAE